MLGIETEIIQGKTINYAQLTALSGYCFYDIDAIEEEKAYMTKLTTPITDINEIERKYVVVQGNADLLNEELEKLREEKTNEDTNVD